MIFFFCSCIMHWDGEALHSGLEFKALSCQPGAKYWREVQMTQNADTVGIWPICGEEGLYILIVGAMIIPHIVLFIQTVVTELWATLNSMRPPTKKYPYR